MLPWTSNSANDVKTAREQQTARAVLTHLSHSVCCSNWHSTLPKRGTLSRKVIATMLGSFNRQRLGRRPASLLLVLVLCASVLPAPLPQATAATNIISVVAWTCPPGTDPTTATETLPTTCPAPAESVTFGLTANDLTRRRVTGSGQSASWPAVAGPFVLSIEAPPNEPAVAVCDQNGTITRYDAPTGVVNGELAAGTSLTCQWYRLSGTGAPSSLTPTPTATQIPGVPTPGPDAATPATENVLATRVDVGGRALYLECAGTGTPTVILEAGGPGGTSDRWNVVFDQLTAVTRVCRYDRAGLGQSDPAPDGIRTIQQSVDDLRALLNTIPLGCPCVFAGESWGGSITRLFTGQFPGDVAGLIFVDTVPPGFTDQFATLVSSDEPGFSALMGTENPERMDQLASFRLADGAAPPPPIPIVVLTHGLFLGFPLNFPVDQLEAVWRAGQQTYAKTTHARLIVAATSGNSVLREQPDLVVGAVQTVVNAVRDPAALQTVLEVHRLDATGREIAGSCFQIFTDAGAGTRGEFRGGACDPDADGASDGIIQFAPLPPGSYVVQEAKAPDGLTAAADTPVSLAGLSTILDIAEPPAPATPTVTPTATTTATKTP